MGQVLHPVIIFRGGSEDKEEKTTDEKAPLAVLQHEMPIQLQQAVELEEQHEENMEEDDMQVLNQALVEENKHIEEELLADLNFKRPTRGRSARFMPASFPIECNKWGFIKQPNGCTDFYTAEESFKFFIQQIEQEHPEGPKVVLMDNLGAHRQQHILQNMLDRHIFPLFIPPNRFVLLSFFLFGPS